MDLWRRFEAHWNESRTLAFLLIVSGIAVAVWTIQSTPSPGVAIGLLGAAAGLMGLRPQMHIVEKSGWIMILVMLTTAEIHSIEQDRIQHERLRTDETDRLNAIVQGLQASIQASEAQFQSTIGRVDSVLITTQEVSKLAKDNLDNLTGGDSAAYLSPQPANNDGGVSLAIVNPGRFALTGVTVSVADITTVPFKVEPDVFVGTLASHVVRPIGLTLMPIPGTNPPGVASFQINIYAQNGTSRELLQFRRGTKSFWDHRATVTREAPQFESMLPRNPKPKSDIRGFKYDYGWLEDRPIDSQTKRQ